MLEVVYRLKQEQDELLDYLIEMWERDLKLPMNQKVEHYFFRNKQMRQTYRELKKSQLKKSADEPDDFSSDEDSYYE